MRVHIPLLLVSMMVGISAQAQDEAQLLDPPDYAGRTFQVLRGLPLEPEAYQEPTAQLVRDGVPQRHGLEEWTAVVLTHELHQHVGIMTVVGAKMAVRAGELLEAPGRAVKVLSETGPEPPFSCAVDGMQAGLGSTYAQQLIVAPKVQKPTLAATFSYGQRVVRLSLKPEYSEKITRCIQDAIEEHGNLTPDYFMRIKEYCYTVWADWDRKTIFKEETL